MSTSSLPAIVLIASVLLIAGCSEHRDDGPVARDTRQLDAFDSIEMEGAARLEITIGGAQSVEVEGREAVVSRVDTEVRGHTLRIQSKPKDWFITNGRPRVTLRITLPELESLRLEGGNDVRMTGFAGGQTRIRVAGATHMKADGKLDELTVHMAGAGHADLSQLLANEAKVTLDGVGSVIVHPTDTLDATMNGVGAILYTGSPREVNTRMNGLGTIGRRDEKDVEASDPIPRIDPESLQPEYEDAPKREEKPRIEVI